MARQPLRRAAASAPVLVSHYPTVFSQDVSCGLVAMVHRVSAENTVVRDWFQEPATAIARCSIMAKLERSKFPARPVGTTFATVGPFLLLFGLLYAAFGVASPFLPALMEATGYPGRADWDHLRRCYCDPAHLRTSCWTHRRPDTCATGNARGLYHRDRAGSARLPIGVRLLGAACGQSAACAGPGSHNQSGRRAGGRCLQARRLRVRLGAWRGLRRLHRRVHRGWLRDLGVRDLDRCRSASNLMLAVPFAARLVPPVTVSRPATDRISQDGLSALLRMAVFRRVVLVAALVLGSHALHDTFSIIRWTNAGISSASGRSAVVVGCRSRSGDVLRARAMAARTTATSSCDGNCGCGWCGSLVYLRPDRRS